MKNAPCYQCEERAVGCHANCPEYKDYTEERARVCSAKKADTRARGYFIDQCRKTKHERLRRQYD